MSKDNLAINHSECVPASAMTLRDYFAAKAMQSLVSAAFSTNPALGSDGVWLETSDITAIVCEAYCLADAMVRERDVP